VKTLDIYRLLPRTNCGRCGPGVCMAFAVCLSRGQCRPEDCPGLEAGARAALSGKIDAGGDWREELVASLTEELGRLDLARHAGALGLERTPEGFSLSYHGEAVPVGAGALSPGLSAWDRVLILRYLLSGAEVSPGEDWTAFRDLKSGRVKAAAFREEVEAPLARLFGEDEDRLLSELIERGAQRRPDLPSDLALVYRPLPRIPWLIQLWRGEEGLPAEVSVLPDRTATAFLDVESLIFLGEQLIGRLSASGGHG